MDATLYDVECIGDHGTESFRALFAKLNLLVPDEERDSLFFGKDEDDARIMMVTSDGTTEVLHKCAQ